MPCEYAAVKTSAPVPLLYETIGPLSQFSGEAVEASMTIMPSCRLLPVWIVSETVAGTVVWIARLVVDVADVPGALTAVRAEAVASAAAGTAAAAAAGGGNGFVSPPPR